MENTGSENALARSRVIVVLPAYNESGAIAGLINDLATVLAKDSREYHIVVVDDGSSDDTAGKVQEAAAAGLPVTLERHAKNMNLGPTLRDGLKKACALADDNDIIITMDADATHTPDHIPAMTKALQDRSADVVIASRFQRGSAVFGVPAFRQLCSFGASLLFRLIFPIGEAKDYTCGYRAFRAQAVKAAFKHYGDAFIEETGFQCLVDVLLRLSILKPAVVEVPLTLRYDRKTGASKMKVSRTIIATLRLLAKRKFSGRDRPPRKSPGMKKNLLLVCPILILVLTALVLSSGKIRSLVTRQRMSVILNQYDRSREHKYVVYGKKGWLFYLEELRYCLLYWYKKGDGERIAAFARELAGKGVVLIVVPVPTKVDVYPELLTGFDGEACVSRRRFIGSLQTQGVNTIDLLPLFRSMKSGEKLYGRTDTHWCRRGISLAAGMIADRLHRLTGQGAKTGRFWAKDTVIDHYQGDMASQYPELSDTSEQLPLSMVMCSATEHYHGSDSSSVLIFGDSYVGWYSARYAADIAAHCALLQGEPLQMNWMFSGYQNAPKRIRYLLERGGGRIKTVIWIFSCRSLMEAKLDL